MQNLFVYGSLQFPEITKGLTGKSFKTAKAKLAGYKRYSVFDADYPAIIKEDLSEVCGKVLFDVDAESLHIISFFEGDEYEIATSVVTVQNKKIPVLIYVWKGDKSILVANEWSKTTFKEESLTFYTKHIIPETVHAFNQMNDRLNS